MSEAKLNVKYYLITSMNFPEGGAGANYLNLFCKGLNHNGYSITVLLLKGHAFGSFTYKGPRKNTTSEGIKYVYLGFKQRSEKKFLKITEELISLSRLILFLFSLIGKGKSSRIIVYNSDLLFNIPIHFSSKLFRFTVIKFVAEIIDSSEFGNSIFGKIKRKGYILNYRWLNKLADKLIVFSSFLKDEYLKMGYKRNNIIIQPNLTDFEYWKHSGAKLQYTLGYSGAPYLKDGLYDLFRSIELLKKDSIFVNLLIVGDAIFGESLIPRLKEECQKLGILENVTFTGLVDLPAVREYLSQCEILTLTRPLSVQTKAGFPTKLGEYFATMKPIIATDFGDMNVYFKDGVDIVMAECGNPISIANKIKWMLENENKLKSITEKGYEHAKELLDYRNSVRKIIKSLEFTES